MDAAVAGLIGAGIGASSSLITVWIQARYQAKRERAKFAMEFAERDRQLMNQEADASGKTGPRPPVVLYAHYHRRMFDLLERGKLNDKTLRKMTEENRRLGLTILEMEGY